MTADNLFADRDADAYYAETVDRDVNNQITAGQTETLSAPEDPCTWAQIATFLYRDPDWILSHTR